MQCSSLGTPITGTVKYLQLKTAARWFCFSNKLDKFSNPVVQPVWNKALKLKEEVLCTRIFKNAEALNYKARKLRPLYVGSRCLLQNQSSTHPCNRNWVVIEVLPHNQLVVRIDGSLRLNEGIEGFWGSTQSQQVLIQRLSMIGIEIDLAHRRTM